LVQRISEHIFAQLLFQHHAYETPIKIIIKRRTFLDYRSKMKSMKD